MKSIKLSEGEMKLSELFVEIENQTGLILVVNIDKIDSEGKVKIVGGERALIKVLDEIKEDLGYDYTLKDRYIIISPNKNLIEHVAKAKEQPPLRIVGYDSRLEKDIERYRELRLAPVITPQYREVVHIDTLQREGRQETTFRYPSHSIGGAPAGGYSIDKAMRPARLLTLKLNLLWAATLTPNLALEVGLGKRISIELSGGINRWNLKGTDRSNKKLAHWVIKPEFRYWFCERLDGHYIGIHGLYGKYNIGGYNIPLLFDKEYRYQGKAYGGGVSYGYNWQWTRSWGMEFSLSMGVAHLDYIKKGCEKCGDDLGRYTKTYFGPTGIGAKIVFTIIK